MFKILSIDGGGIRGIYAAYILKRIREDININFSECFDLIVGTSTGSIIAAALANNYPIEKVCDFYIKEGKKIFRKNILSFWKIFGSKYNNKYLAEKLDEVFGDTKLSDIKNGLIIPATDIGAGRVFCFKSSFHPEFTRDKDIFLRTAVLSSCSAPCYFDPVICEAPEYWGDDGLPLKNYLLVDGGLWANNPAIVGLTEAFSRRFQKGRREVMLMSIGTGIGDQYYSAQKGRSWGLATGWGSTKLVDSIFNIQMQTNDNVVQLILEKDNYLRINFRRNQKLSLDDIKIIPDLIKQAEYDYAKNKENINKFF